AGAMSYVASRSETRASKMLGGALHSMGRPVKGADATAEESEQEDSPPFATQRAKDEEVSKQLTELRQKYPRTRAAVTSALPLAEAQYRLEDYDRALVTFEDFLKAIPAGDLLRAEALEGEGYAFEAKGQLEQALLTFDQMARTSKADFMPGMGLFHRARILILQNKKDEAAKALVEIKNDHPTSAAARMAAERLAMLSREGVKIPEAQAAKPAADAG
ncbi:MAG TPA: tetratricopeptide repeat protein, partial [Myxococcaceae bacterium]|nr:tetratricopeptide repeat protein [Myxococcaceae bacterium]